MKRWNYYSLPVGSFGGLTFNGAINSLFIDGTTAYVAGEFTSITDASGTSTRNRAGAINLQTGLVTAWDPNLNGFGQKVIVTASNAWVTGDFTTAGGHTTVVAKTNKTTGVVDTGFAVLNTTTSAGRALATDASFVYVASNGLIPLGRYDISTGTQDLTWVVTIAATSVNDIATAGTNLYIVGGFTACQATTRNRAASVALSNAALQAWDPNCVGNPFQLTVDTVNSVIYILGNTTTIGGTIIGGVGQVDFTAGTLTSWRMTGASSPGTYGLCTDGINVWLGGQFTTVNGSSRTRLAKGDASAGTLDGSWLPTADGAVFECGFGLNGTLVLTGAFGLINGVARTNFAVVNASSGALL